MQREAGLKTGKTSCDFLMTFQFLAPGLLACFCAKFLQPCLTSCDYIDCSPPGSSVHGFSRQEYWRGVPCLFLGDIPNPGIKPVSLMSPALAGMFFITRAIREALRLLETGLFLLIFGLYKALLLSLINFELYYQGTGITFSVTLKHHVRHCKDCIFYFLVTSSSVVPSTSHTESLCHSPAFPCTGSLWHVLGLFLYGYLLIVT